MLFLLACDPPPILLGATGGVDDSGSTDTGPEPEGPWGDGRDGGLTVSSEVNLSEWTSGIRTAPDAVAFGVTYAAGTTVTLAEDPEGLAVGDELLLLDLRGTPESLDGVGTYRFVTLVAIGADLTIAETITAFDTEDHVVIAQRIPQYTDVTVTDTGMLTTSGWRGAGGGVFAVRANGSITVEGEISTSSLGYRGGDTGDTYNCDGYQGESWAGLGGGGNSGSYNAGSTEWAANAGGGGSSVTGGGGEHAGGALPGDPFYDGVTPPDPGEAYGDASLATLRLGSGGGGVWNDGSATAGPGGAGGGIVFLASASITAASANAISAAGEDATAWSTGTYTYGAGGGSGGVIWVQADTLALGEGALDARGGLGETNHIRWGGDGGVGRVRIDCGTINGEVCTSAALVDVAEPEVGFVGVVP